MAGHPELRADALARLYDLDLADEPGDVDLYLALAARAGGPIVELAVGTGRVAVALARAGHAIVGIDRDPAMLARARTRAAHEGLGAGRLELVEADVLDPRASDAGSYRLAILALNSLLLFADRSLQERVIAVMATLVAPGGLVAIDAWQPQPFDLVRLDGRLSLEWLREDPETGREVSKTASGWYDAATRVVTLTTIFDEAEPGGAPVRWTRVDRMRLAAADELVAWAGAAGLEVEQLGGDYELAPYGSGSERAIVVARRPR
ncbi:MAG: class I SAM-dependent methyltransferase [Chloroflexi bacterium]|nr:class I SAM-dependent methyltransferase [Chloroflexota bacterium]